MIYNVRPLYTGNLKGSGQSIAVLGRSNVKMSDIQSFRSQFGLPVNNPTVIVAQGSDPGFTGTAMPKRRRSMSNGRAPSRR